MGRFRRFRPPRRSTRLAAGGRATSGLVRRNGRDLPWRHTKDPYAILVSEVMLQQTQVERVIPRYLAWLERWPTPAALAAATPADVIRAWQGLGYNRRGLNLHRAALRDRRTGLAGGSHRAPRRWPLHRGCDPQPGVRRAGAARRHERRRIQERTGHSFGPDALQALFDLGATVCLARVPRCDACPLADGCPSRGRRYEPLRKQSPFEGSFRQRRALLLREVAAEPRAARDAGSRGSRLAPPGRPRRTRRRARPPACLDRVVHPDVGLDVDALVPLAVDLDRDERARDDVGARLREDQLRPVLPLGDRA